MDNMNNEGKIQLMLEESGPILNLEYEGKNLTFFNQRSDQWTYPYEHERAPKDNLHTAGCGLFALSHGIQWLQNVKISPTELADFSKKHGGRGDDGADRPTLLAACMDQGLGQKYGFYYQKDGLLNDLDQLWQHIFIRKGIALCNLRKGHIVVLVEGAVYRNQKVYLAIDSYSENNSEKIRDCVLKVIEPSRVTASIKDEKGTYIGTEDHYGMFWVDAQKPMDYNLIYRIPKED